MLHLFYPSLITIRFGKMKGSNSLKLNVGLIVVNVRISKMSPLFTAISLTFLMPSGLFPLFQTMSKL